jgi:chromosome segregation ATPase
MQNNTPTMNTSPDYDSYLKNVDSFNKYFNSTVSDIYKRLELVTQSINELDKIRQNSIDPSYVKRIDEKLNKLASDLNGVISGFNSAVDKINDNYKDSFDKIGRIGSTVEALSLSLSKLSSDLSKTINNFNSVSDSINAKSDADSTTIKNLNDSFAKLSDMVKANINQLNSTDNELAEKLTKLSETVYSGLPAINGLVDDVNELKKLHASINSKFENLTNSTNALAVETNGLNLKLETLGKEFQNIQQGVSDTQKHVMDFINIARSTAASIGSYNPESMNISLRKDEDRIENLEKEVPKIVDNYNNIQKSVTDLTGKISDLAVVKNAGKLFETVQAVAKSTEDSEAKMTAQASKMENMFNEVSAYMNRFVETNNKVNDLSRRISDFQNDFEKLRSNLSLFATKDDVIELHSKIDNVSRGST